MNWLGRGLLWVAYLVMLAGLFAIAGYFGFSTFVRRGVTPVPDLSSLTLEEARALVGDRGLELRHRAEEDRFSDQVAVDCVLEQTPSAGSLAKRGGWVEVVLSRGERTVLVPDVAGKALPAAQVALAGVGLNVGGTAQILIGEGSAGSVVGQRPAAGARVGRGSAVQLYLAAEGLETTYVMPDLVNRSYREVRHFLEFHGFRVGSTKFEPYEGVDRELVLRQFPLPGHPLRRGEVISLVVAATDDEKSTEGGFL
jgi:serine/threonine-protein kinase